MSAPRSRFLRAVFFTALCAVIYLALMPNTGRARFKIVPEPMYRWLEAPWHDDFGNMMAFGFLAFISFHCQVRPEVWKRITGTGAFSNRLSDRMVLLAALLSIVVAIEILQIWIPGRTSSLQDVCTGWSGIFAAWLLFELRDARG